jgi:hypothetical protein
VVALLLLSKVNSGAMHCPQRFGWCESQRAVQRTCIATLVLPNLCIFDRNGLSTIEHFFWKSQAFQLVLKYIRSGIEKPDF